MGPSHGLRKYTSCLCAFKWGGFCLEGCKKIEKWHASVILGRHPHTCQSKLIYEFMHGVFVDSHLHIDGLDL